MQVVQLFKPKTQIFTYKLNTEGKYTYVSKDFTEAIVLDPDTIREELLDTAKELNVHLDSYLKKYGVSYAIFKKDTPSKSKKHNLKLYLIMGDIVEKAQQNNEARECMLFIFENNICSKAQYARYSNISRQTLYNYIDKSTQANFLKTQNKIIDSNNKVRQNLILKNTRLVAYDDLSNIDFFKKYKKEYLKELT